MTNSQVKEFSNQKKQVKRLKANLLVFFIISATAKKHYKPTPPHNGEHLMKKPKKTKKTSG